jgi:hypothetical protein
MLWVTWRQHRMQLVFGAAVLAVLLAFLLRTGLEIASTFRSSGLEHCLSFPGRNCGDVSGAFTRRFSGLQFTVPLFLILPALIGAFWGAPLVAREVEQGTHRLAWTQGVTRVRWAWNKIAVLAAATVAGAAALAWTVSWWSRPLVASANDDRFSLGVFDLRGAVPVAYALFALGLGVVAGTVIRRVLPAMGATLAAYAAVRIPVELWARPHFAAAKTVSYQFDFSKGSARALSGAWVLSTKTVDGAGHMLGNGEVLDFNILAHRCPSFPRPPTFPSPGVVQACVRQIGLHIVSTYQPANRYWTFQSIESAIFVTLAVALLVFSVWFVRRRIA